jgi:threonine/homoserine/homoserine lactone efflux protein
LALTPGPDITYVVIRSVAQGSKAGLAAALGLVVGVLGHTIFCIIVLTTLLAASTVAVTIVKLMGAVYLIYLGVCMWRTSGTLDLSVCEDIKPLISIFAKLS